MENHINNSCQVICIHNDDEEFGSGFFVSPTQVVTAAHVLSLPDDGHTIISVRIYRRDGVHEFSAKAEQRDASPLAILTIEESANFIPVTYLGALPKEKEYASAYGFPEVFPSGYNADFIVNHQIIDGSETAPDANLVLDFDSHTSATSGKELE